MRPNEKESCDKSQHSKYVSRLVDRLIRLNAYSFVFVSSRSF